MAKPMIEKLGDYYVEECIKNRMTYLNVDYESAVRISCFLWEEKTEGFTQFLVNNIEVYEILFPTYHEKQLYDIMKSNYELSLTKRNITTTKFYIVKKD